MGRGINIGFGQNPYTLIAAPGKYGLMYPPGQGLSGPVNIGMVASGGIYFQTGQVAGLSNGSAASWQLLANHYVPAYIVPVIMHPRPDTDTGGLATGNPQTWERARLAPAGIPWRVPIAVYGGAWPFQYTVSGPAGMTIGQHYGDTDYGIVSWANPVVGSYSVTVTVTTQDFGRTTGSTDPVGQYSVTWTLVVAAQSDTRFMCIDAVHGSDSNAGTFAAPLQTLAGFSAAASSGKQLFLRAGTYNKTMAILDLTSKAKVWVGYPGESVTIEYSVAAPAGSSYIYFQGGTGAGSGGCSASNITFHGTPTTWPTGSTANDQYHINHIGDRGIYYENTFDSLNGNSAQPTNFSNWSGIAMFATAAMHNYVASVNNTYSNFSHLYSGGACIWYSARCALIEGCSITGFNNPVNVQQGFISKGHVSKMTMRNNRAWVQVGTFAAPSNGISSGCFFQPQGNDGNQGDNPNGNETCWNVGFNPPAGNNGLTPSCAIYGSATYAAWIGYQYRNTLIGPNWMSGSASFSNILYSTNNLYVTEHGAINDATHYGAANLTLNTSGDIVDIYTNRASVVDPTTGQLLSTYASAHGITLGTVGHQVA